MNVRFPRIFAVSLVLCGLGLTACAPSLAELRATLPEASLRPDALRQFEGDWRGMAAAADRLCQPLASLEQRRLGFSLAVESADLIHPTAKKTVENHSDKAKKSSEISVCYEHISHEEKASVSDEFQGRYDGKSCDEIRREIRGVHLQAAKCAALVAELETTSAAMVSVADLGIFHAKQAGGEGKNSIKNSAVTAKADVALELSEVTSQSSMNSQNSSENFENLAAKFEESRLASEQRTAALAAYYQAVLIGLKMKVAGMGEAMKMLDEEMALLEIAQVVPEVDLGGSLRLFGFILLKAPAWPAGPGDLDTALEVLTQAVARYPSHPLNHLMLAEALAEDGRSEEARASLAKGMNLADESVWGPAAALWRQGILEME